MDAKVAAADALEQILAEPCRQADMELVGKLRPVIEMLRNGTVPEPAGGVMTTGEAAEALGVRSINTIKRWAGDGVLEGFRRGGRIVISRRSVETMLNKPELARQKSWEQRVAEALEGFDASDDDLSEMRAAHVGRKPWDYIESRRA